MRQTLIIGSISCFLFVSVSGQSGRRAKETPPTPAANEKPEPTPEKSQRQDETPAVTAERNQDYRCTEDGSLERIVDPLNDNEHIFLAKEVDTPVVVKARPNPSYSKEARTNGVQGFVVLRLVLASDNRISRVKVVRRLPFGLTENAIKAACKIEFKPALKAGHPVSQWLQIEYAFRLANSSIYGP